MYLIN